LAWDSAGRDLNKIEVEASVRQELFRIEGAYVHLGGMHFRYAANMAQHGAVILAGKHDVMEDCTCECMNSSGATFSAEGLVVRRCVFRDNGQLGFGANGAHELLFTECLVENNNTKGFDRGWEAGGDKLVLSRGVVLERSRFLRNRGNGVWFDIGNERCEVRQCLIAENEDSGIFDEISFGLQAHDNVIVANGFASTQGAWGAQAGIAISSSPESVIERNLLVGNREGFDFREQGRTTPRIGKQGEEPVWNREEVVRHNIIALNRDAQIWGWFDVTDNRPWPAVAHEAVSRGGGSEKTKTETAALTLEKLHLSFDENIYFSAPDAHLVEWGVPWRRHKTYASLEAFRDELGLDRGSRFLSPPFRNVNGLDFRLSSDAMADLGSSYPQGPVPGVELGSSGEHR
ncbi:MAG TPA: right-handed parallel beta-helix repeat-containing protein, partial [Terriglobales bacterium]|nr:right-handed parallel beta-helix repeat-containing protein [Terriglobales bacterium]